MRKLVVVQWTFLCGKSKKYEKRKAMAVQGQWTLIYVENMVRKVKRKKLLNQVFRLTKK